MEQRQLDVADRLMMVILASFALILATAAIATVVVFAVVFAQALL